MPVPAPPPPPPAHLAPLPDARTTADGVRVLAGVPYAAVPGIRPLELDLWLPPATEPAEALGVPVGLPARWRLAPRQPPVGRPGLRGDRTVRTGRPGRHRRGQHRLPALR